MTYMISPEEQEIADRVDIMIHCVRGKTASDVITDMEDVKMFNAVSQNIGHNIVHLLTSDEAVLDVRQQTKLAEALISMFFMGIYMAEYGKARLGPPTKKDQPIDIQ